MIHNVYSQGQHIESNVNNLIIFDEDNYELIETINID